MAPEITPPTNPEHAELNKRPPPQSLLGHSPIPGRNPVEKLRNESPYYSEIHLDIRHVPPDPSRPSKVPNATATDTSREAGGRSPYLAPTDRVKSRHSEHAGSSRFDTGSVAEALCAARLKRGERNDASDCVRMGKWNLADRWISYPRQGMAGFPS